MTLKIAFNAVGSLRRAMLRAGIEHGKSDTEIVAFDDPAPPRAMSRQLAYASV